MTSDPYPDPFDRLPDPIVLLILNHISDIRALLRCRPVSKRFNNLVPQADNLLLRVDRVISTTTSHDGVSFVRIFSSVVLNLLLPLVYPKPEHENPTVVTTHNSPSRILRGFDSVKHLRIELPSGALRPHKDDRTSVRWVARFGRTLRSCVILALNRDDGSDSGGVKTRVAWTIKALIAASARHHMVAGVVREQGLLSRLVVDDREGEGTVVMDEDGLREFRGSGGCGEEETETETEWWWNDVRAGVLAVGMKMRYEARLELSGGVVMEGATLVVVRPKGDGVEEEENCGGGDEALVREAFGNEGPGGVVAEAVERLLECRTYVLEINSFSPAA